MSLRAVTDPAAIKGWHAHVYFSPEEATRAGAVCAAVRDRFGVAMGRLHTGPVGPHPTGSCQLTVPPEAFSGVMEWLALNRDDLVVFVHAETGDVWADHTRHVVWLGESRDLRLDVLRDLLSKP